MIIIAISRILLYLLLGLECLLISFLYREGTLRYNPKSLVIKNLQKLFMWLGIMFIYHSFLPLIRIFSIEVYDLFCIGILAVDLPVLYYFVNFRENSIKKSANINYDYNRKK